MALDEVDLLAGVPAPISARVRLLGGRRVSWLEFHSGHAGRPLTTAQSMTWEIAARTGLVTARLTGPQGSGILTSMSRANALLVVPEDRPVVEAGETLHALPFGDSAGLTAEFAL